MVARATTTDLYAAAAPRRRGSRGGIWSTPEPPPMGVPTVRLTPRGHGRPLRPPERAAVRRKLGLRGLRSRPARRTSVYAVAGARPPISGAKCAGTTRSCKRIVRRKRRLVHALRSAVRAHRYLQKILENRDLAGGSVAFSIRKWGAAPLKKRLGYRETASMGPS